MSDSIKAIVVYNPLEIESREEVELVYQPGQPLKTYLGNLPQNVIWEVALNGDHVPEAGYQLVILSPGDEIVIAPTPTGGGQDGKSVLSIVATLALSAFAPVLGGKLASAVVGAGASKTAVAIATAAVSVAGGLLINTLLPPPDIGSNSDEITYGIDGPKNTATEGVPVPVLYGEHAFGGNYIDLYTENATDAEGKEIQYLYGRILVSEGPIESIESVYINDQEASSFEDLEIKHRLGHSGQGVANWFEETVSLFNQGIDLSETFISYTTSQAVDRLRLDFTCPIGLYELSGRGARQERTVEIVAQFRKQGETEWSDFVAFGNWVARASATETAKAFAVDLTYTPSQTWDTGDEEDDPVWRLNDSGSMTGFLEHRELNSADPWKQVPISIQATSSSIGSSRAVGSTTVEITGVPDVAREFRVVVSTGGPNVTIDEVRLNKGISPLKILDDRAGVVRRSFSTGVLENAVYEVQYRRTTPEGDTEEDIFDKVQIADVAEILTDKLQLPYTAWVGFKMKLTGQLSSIPTLTGVAKGRLVTIYDHNGNATDVAWSDNPKDILLDAYTNKRYGAQMEAERVDWAQHEDWKDICAANGWTFNGVFSDLGDIDEAARHIYLAGRAQRITSGARVGVVVDNATSPSMIFGAGNMQKGSFELTYLPFDERVNDLEVTYFDKTDRYKQRSVRTVNHAAIARGEPIKTATIRLKGITDPERADREGVFRMNYNLLVSRSASWISPVEAVGCSVGDVVLVQHEMPEWNQGGRIASGSKSVITLDRDVTFKPGKSYSLLIHQNKDRLTTANITNQSSNLITVDEVISVDSGVGRAVIGGEDLRIARILPKSSTTDLLLENRASSLSLSGSCQLWKTDVLEIESVVNPATSSNVETATVTLQSDLSSAPEDYANFMFGEDGSFEKPFRIKKIGKETSGYVPISAVEYVEEVYSDQPVNTTPSVSVEDEISNVRDLVVEEQIKETEGGVYKSKVVASWRKPQSGNYIKGVVQASINGDPFQKIDETNGTTLKIGSVERGDTIIVRVIAVTKQGRAPTETAPTATITLQGHNTPPEKPTGWTGASGINSITLDGPNALEDDFRKFRIYGGDGGNFAGATPLVEVTASQWTRDNIPANDTITRYWVTAIDTSKNESVESDPIDVTPRKVASNDLEQTIQDDINQAKTTAASASSAAATVAADLASAQASLSEDIDNALSGATELASQLQGFLSDPLLSSESSQSWVLQPNDGTLTKIPNEVFDIGQTWQMVSTGTQEMAIQMESNRSIWKGDKGPLAIVVEVHFTPESTTNLQAAGIRALWVYNNNGNHIIAKRELADIAVSPIVVGQDNVARCVLKHNGTNPSNWSYDYLRVSVETSSDQFSGGSAAQHDQNISIHKIFIRAALEEEIGTGQVGAAIDSKITSLRSDIEAHTGALLSSSLDLSYYTITAGDQAIATSIASLKADIENPTGSSLGALVETNKLAQVAGDSVLAADISKLEVNVTTNNLTWVPSSAQPDATSKVWTTQRTGDPGSVSDFSHSDWEVRPNGRLRFNDPQSSGGSNGFPAFFKRLLSVEEGDFVKSSVKIIVENVGTSVASNALGFEFVWLDEDFALVSQSYSFHDLQANGNPVRVTSDKIQAPAGAAYCRIGVYLRATFPSPAPGYATIRKFSAKNISDTEELDGRIDRVMALDSDERSGTVLGTLIDTLEVDAGGNPAKVINNSTAISTLEGYAAAMVGFQVLAGNQVSLLNLFAVNDPNGNGQSYSIAQLKAADILLDGTVLGRHLIITEGWGNEVADGVFKYGDFRAWSGVPSVWSIETYIPSSAPTQTPQVLRESEIKTEFVLKMPADSSDRGMDGQEFKCDAGDTFSWSFWYASGGTTRDVSIRLRVEWYDNAGNFHSNSNLSISGFSATTWTKAGPEQIAAPVDGYGIVRVMRYDGGTGSGDAYMTKIKLVRRNSGAVIIEDGTITADLLNVTSLETEGIGIFGGSIKSDDFIAGTSGWRLSKSGTLEIANLIDRSALTDQAVSDLILDNFVNEWTMSNGLGSRELVATRIINLDSDDFGVDFQLSWQARARPAGDGNLVRIDLERDFKTGSGDSWTTDQDSKIVFQSADLASDTSVAMSFHRREFGTVDQVRYRLYVKMIDGGSGNSPAGSKPVNKIRAQATKIVK